MQASWARRIQELTDILDLKSIIDFLFVLGFGIIIALIISSFISKAIAHRASAHYTILIRRLLYYGLLLITLIVALPISPLNLAALGAIFTLAVGFATRAPLSNIINGLALVFEKPFVIGDMIKLDSVLGKVISIDLLSVRIISRDNILIRIPNEQIFSNKLQNLSKYKIRSLELMIHVSYTQDINALEKIILEYAQKHNEILENPTPTVQIESFRVYSVEVRINLWVSNASFNRLSNSLPKDVLQALNKGSIQFVKPITLETT